MAVESVMVPIGSPAPDFELPDLTGAVLSSDEISGVMLVAFLCNHCPYVRHVEAELGRLAARHPEVTVVGICSNDAQAYPDDAPEHLAEQVQRAGWGFRYLVDEDQSVGRAFRAACTPDFFLYGADRRLAYRGALDASTPGNKLPVTGELLEDAVVRVLAGEPVPEPHRPSMGCSIKWRE